MFYSWPAIFCDWLQGFCRCLEQQLAAAAVAAVAATAFAAFVHSLLHDCLMPSKLATLYLYILCGRRHVMHGSFWSWIMVSAQAVCVVEVLVCRQ
jgi:hypothetical protein